ncbi:MAG TPA: amino acid adenylation domain-containing protein [Opitutaceae bacterium]|nr:amino acid adenylation domain-containing protein [Opitutaceae bacterium]
MKPAPEQTQERLRRLLAQKGIRTGPAADEPAPRPAGEPLPPSFAQERLWFLQRLDPQTRAYHLARAFRIRGPLDPRALGAALDAVVGRHEALRTGFAAGADGRARAELAPAPAGLLQTEDLSALPASAREAAVAKREEEAGAAPFDLSRPPLLRARLLRLAPDEHHLVVCVHHAVFDGWSIGLLARELAAAYAGRGRELPALPLAYGDYAAWQRRRAAGPGWARQLDWWEEHLRGLPPLELPTDRPRPTRASGRGGGAAVRIAPAAVAGLRRVAAAEGATLFTVLLAAFEALLWRHGGQEDFGVGVSVAGRTHRGLEELIGLFVNTVVFRARPAGPLRFAELVRRVQAEAVEVLARQEIPFEQVVDRLHAERDLSRNPVFQAGLFLQNAPAAEFRLGPSRLEPMPDRIRGARFDLLYSFTEAPDGGLEGTLEYSADLFDAATAERITARFLALIGSAGAAPERRLDELDWIPPAEREEIARWACGPEADYAADDWIHEAPDRRDPAATALTAPDGRRYTYGEFCAEAERLARALRGLGAGPEVLVGVCLDRSAELVLALHAVLRAGGAFVPLDPNYPAERLGWMAQDAGAAIIVTTRALAGRVAGTAARLLFVEEPWPDGPARGPRPSGAGAAYIIYTSGSTGRPKGAVNTHEGIRNLVGWVQSAFPLRPGDIFLQKTPCSFDVSVREFFWPLFAGAELSVAEPGAHRDPARVAALVRERGVTDIDFVPSVFRAFLETPGVESCRSLRRIYCTGEELPRDLVDRCRERLGCELHNLYGPTEAAVEFTHHACGPGEGPVPIGRPMARLEVRILGSDLRPVPAGIPGEIFLGGVNLARGYHRRADLTADRWIPHPDGGGRRLYRTGDLGRWRGGGEIVYLGRTDFQVKLRGQRIELGEIEAVLREHPAVRECAVAVRDARLVAYVVPRAGPVDPEPLRAWLSIRLPEYMVPPSWVELRALPLNPAGKTDRKALPAPSAGPAAYAAPEGEREELLAECWRAVLRVPQVGRDDGYFDLGGDSILSLQLQARVRERGWDFDLADLFQHQSLAALARALRPAAARAAAGAAPFSLLAAADRARLPEGLEDAYPLSSLQAGMALHAEMEPGSRVYREVFSYEIRAPWSQPALRAALEALSRRHPILRTSFALRGFSEPLQCVHPQAPAPLEVEDLSGRPRAEQDRAVACAIEEELERGFDWGRAPLWRARVHRRGADLWQFTLAAHHVLLDGWSAASLLAELFDGYLVRAAGGIPAGTPPAPPFARYIAAEREARADAASRGFWLSALAEAGLARLPRRRAPEVRFRQECARRVWDGAALAGLQALAGRAGASLKHVLLAAHLKATQVHTGQADVVAGVITNGRTEDPGAERTLGLFLNTLPLRLRLGAESWTELVRRVFRAEEAAWPHRRFPLAEIQRELGRRELFETTFNYVHYHGLDEVRARPEVEIVDARFRDDNSFPYFAQYSLDTVRGELALELRYDASAFAAEQGQAFAEVHRLVLAAMLADAAAPHAAAPLLPAEEAARVAEAGAARPLPRSPRLLLHQGFFEQAAQRPGAAALVVGRRSWTYGELAARSRAWAERLRGLGAGPESRVGVCLERGEDLVTALLAVLAAGAAYVPLDPNYPTERLALLCGDSQAGLLITRPELAERLPPGPWRRIDAAELASLPPPTGPFPAAEVRPENLAYLIYTSGSTGRPKAAAIEHRSAAALLAWALAEYPPAELAGTLASTSVCFDLSVFEIFAPLAAGGTVILAGNALELAELPARDRLTLLNTVPSAAAEWVRQGAIPAGVRTVNLAGEPLPAALAERIYASAQVAKVYDLYGPSEDTTYSTWALRRRGGPETIGRALPGTALRLLDEFLQPVAFGAAGEIFLGGAGLARGYLGRPELTAERFLPDPFSPGGRLYRTGDLARWREDGQLEFLGRADHQVKIRGFRIELGEIQAALESRADVAEAAVLAREDAAGRKQLVAYVAGPQAGAAGAEALRAWIAERLPEAYVPAHFIPLARLPRTPNGKLDRAALPAPEAAQPRGDRPPPRTPAEKALAGIWASVLAGAGAAADDNFFALGGDSILALQVAARSREAGLAVTPRMIFEHPVLRDLARVAAAEPAAAAAGGPEGGASEALTPIQRWFFAQDFAEPHHWNQAVLLRAREPADPGALERALAAVGARHPALRRRFGRGEDGRWRARPEAGEAFAFRASAWTSAADLEAQCAAEQASLDLSAGPLARAVWFTGPGPDSGRLFLVVHHLAVDGVSWRILFEDLARAYDAIRAGRAPEASRAPDPASWAAWLEARAAQGGFEGERAHWVRLAEAGDPPLPRDRQAGEPVAAETAAHTTLWSAEETEALLRRAVPAHGGRIDDLLLAALALALRDWTGREAHRIALEGHGREGAGSGLDLSSSVGWYTTLYPVRLDLRGAAGAIRALEAVKAQRAAIPSGGLGYGVGRYLADPPLWPEAAADLCFNYLGQFDGAVGPGSRFAPAEEPTGPAASPHGRRPWLIEVNGLVSGGQLRFSWAYSPAQLNEETLRRLAGRFRDHLGALAAAAPRGAPAPEAELDRAISEIEL